MRGDRTGEKKEVQELGGQRTQRGRCCQPHGAGRACVRACPSSLFNYFILSVTRGVKS